MNSNIARFTMIAVACVTLATMVACGNGGSEVSEEEFLAAAQVAAEGAILTPEDVPADWESEPDEPDDDSDESLSGECAYLDQVDDGLPGQAAVAEGPALVGPTHEINTEASVFASDDEAADTMNKYIDTVLSCRHEFIEAAEAEGELAADDRIEIAEVDAPPVGDEARVIRNELASGARSVVVDFMLVRQGRIVLFFAWGGAEPDDAERDLWIGVQVEKAREADESLPD